MEAVNYALHGNIQTNVLIYYWLSFSYRTLKALFFLNNCICMRIVYNSICGDHLLVVKNPLVSIVQVHSQGSWLFATGSALVLLVKTLSLLSAYIYIIMQKSKLRFFLNMVVHSLVSFMANFQAFWCMGSNIDTFSSDVLIIF